jgi:hypothetical protein
MRYTTSPSDYNFYLNASYVPGYFKHDIQRTPLRASYVPGCFTPGIQTGGTGRFGINPVASTSRSNRSPMPALLGGSKEVWTHFLL